MSLSKSKCWYSNNCLHFLSRLFHWHRERENAGNIFLKCFVNPSHNNHLKQFFPSVSVSWSMVQIEQCVLGTNAGKTTVLRCHRCLINTGVEKMNYI